MGTKLTSELKPNPVVSLRTAGTYFKGKLLDKGNFRQLSRGKKRVYQFEVIDGDMPAQVKNEAGVYVDVTIKPGDKISIFAPQMLDEALQKDAATIGSVITIKSEGKLQGKKNEFYKLDVELN